MTSTFTVFYDCLHTKIKLFPQLAKPYSQGAKHKAKFAQLSTLSALHHLQNIAHSDLQNTKHTCIRQTQKSFMMSRPCNSKALTVKLPHL